MYINILHLYHLSPYLLRYTRANKSNTCAHHAIFRSLTLTQTCTSLTVSLRDQSFVEPFIRHPLSASSWKRRVLFPRVALPRTTGRRQEAFHSATKVRWMTTLSYWDTREVTALEGIKTEKVGCSHVHVGALFSPFPCLYLSSCFSLILSCLPLSVYISWLGLSKRKIQTFSLTWAGNIAARWRPISAPISMPGNLFLSRTGISTLIKAPSCAAFMGQWRAITVALDAPASTWC